MDEAPETREAEAAARPRRRTAAWLLLSLMLLAGLLWGGRWVVWRAGHVSTEAGFVKADIAEVAPQVAGRIVAVPVAEGQRVHRGDPLVEIDPSEQERRVAQAEAAVAAARAAAEEARQAYALARRQVPAAIDAAAAALAAARTQVAKAEANRDRWARQLRRFRALLESRAVGRARFEEVQTAAVAAEADLRAAKAQVRLAQARLKQAQAGRRQVERAQAAVAAAEEGVHRAEAALRLARLARAWCTVRSPLDGVVARRLAEPGDLATPGRPVVGVYDPATRYVEARFEETKLRYLAAGKGVELRLDRLPGTPLRGRVVLVGPAAAAEFALIPRDVTAGEFTKVTQRVPVRIAIDHLEDHPEVVPGLSVEVVVAKRG
ncbi:MAG: HlyD family secretion protein [Nitrospirae bacterium]|nr:MAG: HlyD family secretion protein [Nitrospirota bacterium]